jgi:predicted short-subunit dehydrogenase-like oxidoreductase (DUF2520 family)
MKIILIGSGNVAAVFGKLLKAAGHSLTAVVSRNATHAAQLADLLETKWYDDIKNVNADADVYIIAAADDAIQKLAVDIKAHDKIILHTSGAVSKDVLRNVSENYGVLYPLQSLRKEINYTPEIPLLIDASNEETLAVIQLLAASVSQKISVANDEQRLKLHVAAVIASNFSNHLYSLAEDYCSKENIPFKMLVPLIQETANRLINFSPKDVQTGPAVRSDAATMQKHRELLEGCPQLVKLYENMSKSIMDFYGKT